MARETTDLPILRKDFLTTQRQLLETKALGADAALVIVAAVEDSQLRALAEYAREIDLDLLVEVHDIHDLERAMRIDPNVIGI